MLPSGPLDTIRRLPALATANVGRRFSLYAGLLLGSAVALAIGSELVRYRVEHGLARKEVRDDVADVAQQVRDQLGQMSGAIALGARLDASALPEQLPSLYLALVEETPALYQLRHLNATGQETLRVEYDGKRARLVAVDGLQDKSRRSYFNAGLKLTASHIYASPLDLNIEHGRIEEPWRPTLRLVTPLKSTGRKRLIVANFDASHLLNLVEHKADGAHVHRMMLNGAGYWLAGAPKRKLWGFMLAHNSSLAREDPRLWRELATGRQGLWKRGHTLYAVEAMDVEEALHAGRSRHMPLRSDERWLIISQTTLRAPFAWSRGEKLAAGMLMSMGLLLCWYLAATNAAHRAAEAENQRTRAQLQRNERLASLGGLVAGVAHELNTPIGNAVTVVSALADQQRNLERAMRSGVVRKADVATFVQEAGRGYAFALRNLGRAAELVGRFKGIAVDQSSERRRAFELDAYIEQLVATLRPNFKHGAVSLEVHVSSSATLDSYPGALAQIVINLVNNAQLHAFEPGATGVVRVSTETRDGSAVIRVDDDGAGIPEDAAKRIFDPFYTTKLGEGGSGLGLSIGQNLAQDVLGGSLEVVSRPRGTRFELRLPLRAPDVGNELDAHQLHQHSA